MAGTRFDKKQLIAEVEGNYARAAKVHTDQAERIEAKTDTERIDQWRAKQVERVRDFATRLDAGEVTGHELSSFSVATAPYLGGSRDSGRYEREEATRIAARSEKAVAYVRALAEVEPGVVEVSAVDLKRIGYGV